MRCVVKIRTLQSQCCREQGEFARGSKVKSRNVINKDRVGEGEPILRHPG
jgi:hypothetical protein